MQTLLKNISVTVADRKPRIRPKNLFFLKFSENLKTIVSINYENSKLKMICHYYHKKNSNK